MAQGDVNAQLSRNSDEGRTYSEDVARLWRTLASENDLAQFGTSTSRDPERIARDLSKEDKKLRVVQTRTSVIAFALGAARLNIEEANTSRPWTNAKEIGQGQGGSQLYKAAFTWARNNGKTLAPDPAGQ